MHGLDLTPFIISLKLSLSTTLILFILVLPLAYILAFRNFYGKGTVEALVTLPMVLPPTVLGFYLLAAFSTRSPVGNFFHANFSLDLVFSFPGILLASCIHSLPYMVQPLKNGFQNTDMPLVEASYILGKSRFTTLVRVILPNMKPAILSAFIMTFIYSLGEFGAILMIGGAIPGVTKVASIALYESAENMDMASANAYALIFIGISFVFIIIMNRISNLQGGRGVAQNKN
ncbi:MAG: molybdate ABC transporter permease subunit [Brevinematales bacterium]|jgi:molybdate transport system permease protein